MKIEISKLKPHNRNKQLYGEPEVEDLVESLERFGLLQPIRINKYNIIISGHRRVAAALKLGWKFIEADKDEKKIDAIEEIRELIISNQYREKSTETKLREGIILEKVESKISHERRCRNGIPALGTTRDIVGEKIGMSGRAYVYGRQVIKEIDRLKAQGEGAKAAELIKELNRSIGGALKKIRVAQFGKEFWYWRSLYRVILILEHVYKKLSKKRDNKTPNNLGFMIGSIKEMKLSLDTWNPKKIKNCISCGGTSVNPLTKEKCDDCINGKSGLSKESEY